MVPLRILSRVFAATAAGRHITVAGAHQDEVEGPAFMIAPTWTIL
jgi:hypothetical protein